MTIKVHKDFDKQLAKLPRKKRDSAVDVIDKFSDSPNEPSLRNHALTGEWSGYRLISASGDLRPHFRMLDSDTAYFVAIGSHSQLYK